MKSLRIIPFCFQIFIGVFLLGCTGLEQPVPDATRTIELSAPTIGTSAVTEVSRTPIITPEKLITLSPMATSTAVSGLQVTTTVEFTAETEADRPSGRSCSTSPRQIETRERTGIFGSFSQIGFFDDQTIQFSGWAQRPLPTPVDDDTITTPVSPNNNGAVSSWVTFIQAQIKLPEETLVIQRPALPLPLLNPCRGQCTFDTISQSPDGSAQLIQVSDGTSGDLGFWLVREEETVQLVDFVPQFTSWQWSADSSMLWFVFSLYDYGFQSLIVQLKKTPTVLLTDESGGSPVFDGTRYISAFNPIEKTLLLTESEETSTDINQLLTFDLTSSYVELNSIKIVAGIKSVVWNDATQEYLLIIVRDDGLEITGLDGHRLVEVPRTTFEIIFPALADSDLPLGLFLPNTGYAISPSGRYLAIGPGQASGIFVFECHLRQ